ncbi:MucR family transcriptional regulator [Microvirga splendida]|uniref:MucR family transcriptional regulator n=1 Tax=Microvirga splendida TaxID=2795727 RepID=A0ABS0Y5F1_9HYPH|nr:MucR family transcriptional regulator [Microvirga splendida]MBJ6127539.1 MucR family transcriptional regulator [Microvirga splendida]
MSESTISPNFIELSADIVSAYVSNNSVPASELPTLLGSVHTALTKAVQRQNQEPHAELTPAVPVKKSVTPDAIICLEDGKKFKSLKRHLRTTYDMTPEQYRAKWGLPADYPMVAPNYAKARSELARTMGLGQQRKKAAAPVEAAVTGAATKTKGGAAKVDEILDEEVTAPPKGRRTKKAA